jgi:hypothetical protein
LAGICRRYHKIAEKEKQQGTRKDLVESKKEQVNRASQPDIVRVRVSGMGLKI